MVMSEATDAVGVRRSRALATRAALLAAAAHCFARLGYANTKISDITAAAGRAVGVFYDHFESKEALLRALSDGLHHEAATSMHVVESSRHDLTDREQLQAHLGAAWLVTRRNRAVATALFEASVTAAPDSGELWSGLAEQTAVLSRHFQDLIGQGHRLPGDPVLLGIAVGAMVSLLSYAMTPDQEAATGAEVVIDMLTDLVLHGIDPAPTVVPPARAAPLHPGRRLAPPGLGSSPSRRGLDGRGFSLSGRAFDIGGGRAASATAVTSHTKCQRPVFASLLWNVRTTDARCFFLLTGPVSIPEAVSSSTRLDPINFVEQVSL